MLLSSQSAAQQVAAGKIIAYPTEAIYGLGCDPQNKDALKKLIDLKKRDSAKGLIVVAKQWSQLAMYVDPPSETALERAQNTWPGPVTWIMPASAHCSMLLTGGRDTIAVRVSAHPVVRDLCERCNSALVSTSANISGTAPLNTPNEVATAFASNIAGVVKGELGGLSDATSIFDARTGTQLR